MKIHSQALRLLGAFLLGWQAPAFAQEQRHPTPQPVLAEPVSEDTALQPALWRIADEDTTIYLFGTIHVLPEGHPWFTGALAEAADASDELVTEIGPINEGEIVTAVSEMGMLGPDQSLRAMMSAEDRVAFEAHLVKLGLPATAFDRLKPWFVANTLMVLQLQQAGIVSTNGPELFLNQRFSANNRPLVPLETIRYQLGLFDSLPVEAQLGYLRQVIASSGESVALVNRITAEWGAGNPDALAEAMNASTDDPLFAQRLLLDRNKTWSQWLKARLDRPGTVFVAVGAGHLAGRGSVQDELAALGVVTSRIQ